MVRASERRERIEADITGYGVQNEKADICHIEVGSFVGNPAIPSTTESTEVSRNMGLTTDP